MASRRTESLQRLCAWTPVLSFVFMAQSHTGHGETRQMGMDDNAPTYALPSPCASPTLVHPPICTSLANAALSPLLSPSQMSLLNMLGGAAGEYDCFGRGSMGEAS